MGEPPAEILARLWLRPNPKAAVRIGLLNGVLPTAIGPRATRPDEEVRQASDIVRLWLLQRIAASLPVSEKCVSMSTMLLIDRCDRLAWLLLVR